MSMFSAEKLPTTSALLPISTEGLSGGGGQTLPPLSTACGKLCGKLKKQTGLMFIEKTNGADAFFISSDFSLLVSRGLAPPPRF